MKLLYYNWVQFDDPEGRSGGVRQYQSNLISHLLETSDHEIVTVASGIEYDKLRPQMRFEPVANVHRDRVRSFNFVNSPVMAPGHSAFGTERLFDEASLGVWHQFLSEHGPFDVVHFDSLEGIPFTWLRIHELHPETRVVFYAHNYYSVCPQVNLWKNEKRACVDYKDGKDCVTCLPKPIMESDILRAYQVSRMLRTMGIKPGSRVYRVAYQFYGLAKTMGVSSGLFRIAVRIAGGLAGASSAMRRAATRLVPRRGATRPTHVGQAPAPASKAKANGSAETRLVPVSLKKAPTFRYRREHGTELINQEVDVVLATSHRTAEVLDRYGIDPRSTEVCYIGTRVADEQFGAKRRLKPHREGKLTVAFLGYMRRDKGFGALLKALRHATPELQQRLRLVVAAKRTHDDQFDELEEVAQQLDDVLHYNGYTHADLPQILEKVDLGIVPVQWEDNLPQVAIEMVAQGVPILTSDRGGSQELGGNNPAFIFDATSPAALNERLKAIATGKTSLGDYWADFGQLITMEMHAKRLMELYGAPLQPSDTGS